MYEQNFIKLIFIIIY